jgi:hypothetical protein
MSGGISAIKGFDYQATVILSRLLDHFEQYGATALARPEGKDDLDLSWAVNGAAHHRHEQVKKPAEDRSGKRTPKPWTVAKAIKDLMPATISHLSGNFDTQIWILGDTVNADLQSLVAAGRNAPNATAKAYWAVVHGLARNEATETVDFAPSVRQKLRRRGVASGLPADPAEALSRMAAEYGSFAEALGAADVATHYRRRIAELHAILPEVLARTEILAEYGTELEVATRVIDQLEQAYLLQRAVVEDTLFRNLTGFINEIAKEPGRQLGREEFEFALRRVWPQMLATREPPPLVPDHVARRDLVARFTTGWAGKALEVLGISGSGKTMLAAEVVGYSRHIDPDRRVYYAAVRGEISLRDVLVGVAFDLRRVGIPEPFAVSVQRGPADEDALARLARSYSALSQDVLVLVDLVDGTCSPAVARDLAAFIRELSPSAFRIAVLGQESGLYELSAAEHEENGVTRLDLRGFRFEEFVTLVGHHHFNPDRAVLWDIYQRVTAGRPAGLFAKLAHSLARAASLEEMSAMAARPPDEILAHAEQQRFARISGGARSAAEKLVCFALPFRRQEAEDIFPDDNVGAAIREMYVQGLLRDYDAESFEMHETVRAGLEATIAQNVRHAAHASLAAWCAAQGQVTAEIFHLGQAGKADEADRLARAAFLRGERWSPLAAYITSRKLVSASELAGTMAGSNPVPDQYLFARLLRELGGPPPVGALMRMLREQPQRFFVDYQWGLAVVEAILDFEPERLHDLIVFALETAADAAQRESAINWLVIAARRKQGVIGASTVEFFGSRPPEIKRLLLRFLLFGRRRETMRPAFEFLADDPGAAEEFQRQPAWRDLALHIGGKDDALEFLAAMPTIEAAAMVTAKSALLGPLAGLVWAQRKILRAHSIEILRDGAAEPAVLINAIRVLVFLGEPSICALCDPPLSRQDAVSVVAKLVPAVVPALCDRSHYEARLVDCSLPFKERINAFFVLAAVGADLNALYARVKAVETDRKQADGWDFWFVIFCAQAPFAEAIPLLEERLKSADANNINLLVPALVKLGELTVPAATEMLTRALSHPHPWVRQCAAVGLAQRRSRPALPILIAQYAKENTEVLAVGLATAIVASGPASMADLSAGPLDTPATQLWQCILAMRLRDAASADRLVALANDRSQNWQLRRAAIFAAGRLPYEVALERIAPVALAERSPLTIDDNMGLRCHAVLTSTLLCGADGMAPIFARGRAGFIEFFAETFETLWQDTWSLEGLPTGAEAAGWLFDRLVLHGWPAQRAAPDTVLNEINIPMLHSAVLRSFRLNGRPDLIEDQLRTAHHAWFAMKCLMERRRGEARDSGLADRLTALLEASPCKGKGRLLRVIDEMRGVAVPAPAKPAANAAPAANEPPVTYLGYDDIVRVLSRGDAGFKPAGAFVVKPLDAGECERLIRMVDPINDPDRGVENYDPSVAFTQNGHVVARRRVTYAGGAETAEALIRPAVAVANVFGLPNPWHGDLLAGPLAANYVPKYLACLAAADDADRFYGELGQHEDILVPLLCDMQRAKPVLKYVDARIVPFLMRHVTSGMDELFEGLCTLALQIDAPEIDSVLAGLLYRFAGRFDVRAVILQHNDNHALWRGFNRLAEHPRFDRIKGWQSSLAALLQTPMAWFRAENLVRVLERDLRSYILIESWLFKATNWEHFHWDEIDRLDDAGEKLFHQLLEP